MKKAQTAFRFRQRRPKKRGRPRGEDSGVPHVRRAELSRHHPVHVTMRTLGGIGYLRRQRVLGAFEEAFRQARIRFGMRIVHYSIQGNHLHLLVEADDRGALAKGMQGLAIRLAKTLNRLFNHKGTVWSDRYYSHVLRTRREVANALRYVLGNFARHARQWGEKTARFVDAFSSIRFLGFADADAPVIAPRSWLLRIGWRADREPRAHR